MARKSLALFFIYSFFIFGCSREEAWESAKLGNMIRLKELLDGGANVNAVDKNGWSALMMVASNGNIEITDMLLDKGAEVSLTNQDGKTALIIAMEHGKYEVAKLIITRSMDVNSTNEAGWTPLMMAVTNNRLDLVRMLITRIANVNIRDIDGNSALMLAASRNNLEMCRFLLDNGASINMINNQSNNALTLAPTFQITNVVSTVVSNYWENERSVYVTNLVTNTVTNEDMELYRYLVSRGAATNVELFLTKDDIVLERVRTSIMGERVDTNTEKTSDELIIAAGKKKDLEKVQELLGEDRRDINITDYSGYTALMRAAMYGNLQILQLLIERDADLNLQERVLRNTALMIAIDNDNFQSAEELLRAYANVHIQNINGDTALLLACKKNNDYFVDLLIRYGASVYVTNNSGETPLNIATMRGNRKMSETIQKKMGLTNR